MLNNKRKCVIHEIIPYWHLGTDCYYKLTSGNGPSKRHTCLQFLKSKVECAACNKPQGIIAVLTPLYWLLEQTDSGNGTIKITYLFAIFRNQKWNALIAMSLNTLLQYWHLGIDCYYKLISGNGTIKMSHLFAIFKNQKWNTLIAASLKHCCGIDIFVLIVITN